MTMKKIKRFEYHKTIETTNNRIEQQQWKLPEGNASTDQYIYYTQGIIRTLFDLEAGAACV
jgi:hypothetical protein